MTQGIGELEVTNGVLLHLLGKETIPVATLLFGTIHRSIPIFVERFHVFPIRWIKGKTYRGCDAEFMRWN